MEGLQVPRAERRSSAVLGGIFVSPVSWPQRTLTSLLPLQPRLHAGQLQALLRCLPASQGSAADGLAGRTGAGEGRQAGHAPSEPP